MCSLFCQSPRSRLKHVTRLGSTRHWISTTGLMVVQGRMREMIPTGAIKCNRPTDFSHIQNVAENLYLPLIRGIALTTVYALTCYTVMHHYESTSSLLSDITYYKIQHGHHDSQSTSTNTCVINAGHYAHRHASQIDCVIISITYTQHC